MRRKLSGHHLRSLNCLCVLVCAFASNTCADQPARLRVSVGNAPPLEFRSPDGTPQGFAVDVIREAARREGIGIIWQNGGTADQNNADLRAAKLDLIAAAPPSQERLRDFYVSEPWWWSEMLALAQSGGTLKSDADLSGHRLATPAAAAHDVAAVYPRSSVISGPNTKWAAEQVCLGEAEVAVVESMYLRELLLGASRPCRDAHLSSFDVKARRVFCIIARPGVAAAAARLRKRIDEITMEGSLAVLASKHLPIATPQATRMGELLARGHERQIVKLEFAGAGMLVITALGILFWQYRSRQNLKRLNNALLRAQTESAQRLVTVTSQLAELRASGAERDRLRTALSQSQKMESVGRLAGGVAHDFNNLLTVVNGYADLLLADDTCPGVVRTRLDHIRRAGEQAAVLTRQLLAFARKQSIQPVPTKLNSLVKEVGSMLGRLLPANIELVYRLAPDLCDVMVDPGQMHQVLMNLVLNARDAMPDGGTVIIQTANQDTPDDEAEGQHRGPGVMVAVRDTGAGMEPAVAEHIFEPFFTTKPFGEGTGLGLATVYGIVRQSGGAIRMSTKPGEGSEFRIYFPATSDPGTRSSHKPVPAPAGSTNASLLVVDDREDVRVLVVEILRQADYVVFEASSGKSAMELTRDLSLRVDMLVTDIAMPGMSGTELAAHLVVHRPHLKVLYMSGYSEDVIPTDHLALAHVAFISKPIDPDTLLEKVHAAIGAGNSRI